MPIDSSTEENNLNTKMIEWAAHYLSSHGYVLKNNLPETVQETPWSYVIRFETVDGHVYLKKTPALIAIEANIIQSLRVQFNASVPNVIAQNTEFNCFIMKDAGKSLRSILKQKFDAELLCKAIDQFTSLQLAVGNRNDVLLNLGVPDWRLDKFPALYEELLSEKEILLADGLTEIEFNELTKLTPLLANLCKKLSDYSIKQTLVQPDFNDNNTLIDDTTQTLTIIDLGEIAISHPFFSLINFLHVIKKHHALTEDDNRYQTIKDACFKNFEKFESKKYLLDALEVANLLFYIYGALASRRLMLACEKSKFTGEFQRHGRSSIPLREFISACKDFKI